MGTASRAVLATVLVVGTVVFMEWLAAWSHRHIMHGWGWSWHKSHHQQTGGGTFERNDLYALIFASVAIALFGLGTYSWPLWWVAVGMTSYGLLYFLVHDGLVHRRWGLRLIPRRGYLKRIYQAHRLHHAVRERDGCVSFGFIYARPTDRIVRELRAKRAVRSAPD